jgi:hypothetical protein
MEFLVSNQKSIYPALAKTITLCIKLKKALNMMSISRCKNLTFCTYKINVICHGLYLKMIYSYDRIIILINKIKYNIFYYFR